MKRKYNLLYDNQYDRLLIAGKTDSDIMIGSVRVLNVILDFNSKKEVVNAELLHASEYLTSLNLNPNILDKITDGRLSFRQLRNGYEIIFVLITDKKVIPIPYNVQLPTQKQISITS